MYVMAGTHLRALTSLEASDDGAREHTEALGLRESSVVEGAAVERRPRSINFPGVAWGRNLPL